MEWHGTCGAFIQGEVKQSRSGEINGVFQIGKGRIASGRWDKAQYRSVHLKTAARLLRTTKNMPAGMFSVDQNGNSAIGDLRT